MRSVQQIKIFIADMLQYLITWGSSFFIRRLFIDALGIEYLGVGGMLGGILGMLSLAELGVGSSIVFSLYKPIAKGDMEKIHQIIYLFRKLYVYIGVFVALAGLAIAPFLGTLVPEMQQIPHHNLIFMLFLANSVIPYFFAYNSTLYIASQRSYVIKNINTISYMLGVGVTIAILLFIPDFVLLAACSTLSAILVQIYIFFMARREWPWLKTKPRKKLPKEDIAVIRKNVGAIMCHQLGNYCVNGTGGLIVGTIVNLTSVGLLTNYKTLISVLSKVVSAFFNAMSAGLGELIAVSDKQNVHRIFDEMNFLAFWLYGYAMIGFCCCADSLVDVWLGEGYGLTQTAVLFLGAELFMTGMRIPPHMIKAAAGQFSNDKYAPLVQAALNLGMGIPCTMYFGVSGMLFSVLFCGIAVPGWFRPYVLYRDFFKSSVWPYYRMQILYVGLVFGVHIFLRYAATWYVPENILWALLYRACLATLVFHVVLFGVLPFLPGGKKALSRASSLISKLLHKK